MESEKMTCPYCNKEYKGRGGCTNHIRSAHPKEFQNQLSLKKWLFKTYIEMHEKEIEGIKANQPIPNGIASKLLSKDNFVSKVKNSLAINSVELHTDWREFEERNFALTAGVLLGMYGEKIILQIKDLNPEMVRKSIKYLHDGYQYQLKDSEEIAIDRMSKDKLIEYLKYSISQWQERIQETEEDSKKINSDISAKETGGFPCPYCSEKVKSKAALRNHKKEIHFEEYQKEQLKRSEEQLAEDIVQSNKLIAVMEEDIRNGDSDGSKLKEFRKEEDFRTARWRLKSEGLNLYEKYNHYFGKNIPTERKDEAIQILEEILQILVKIEDLNKTECEETIQRDLSEIYSNTYDEEFKYVVESTKLVVYDTPKMIDWESESIIKQMIEDVKAGRVPKRKSFTGKIRAVITDFKQEFQALIHSLVTEGNYYNYMSFGTDNVYMRFSAGKGVKEIYCDIGYNDEINLDKSQKQLFAKLGFNLDTLTQYYKAENDSDLSKIVDVIHTVFYKLFKIDESTRFCVMVNGIIPEKYMQSEKEEKKKK
jgi:arsenate reductase-like glutaredoxin family protein